MKIDGTVAGKHLRVWFGASCVCDTCDCPLDSISRDPVVGYPNGCWVSSISPGLHESPPVSSCHPGHTIKNHSHMEFSCRITLWHISVPSSLSYRHTHMVQGNCNTLGCPRYNSVSAHILLSYTITNY